MYTQVKGVFLYVSSLNLRIIHIKHPHLSIFQLAEIFYIVNIDNVTNERYRLLGVCSVSNKKQKWFSHVFQIYCTAVVEKSPFILRSKGKKIFSLKMP